MNTRSNKPVVSDGARIDAERPSIIRKTTKATTTTTTGAASALTETMQGIGSPLPKQARVATNVEQQQRPSTPNLPPLSSSPSPSSSSSPSTSVGLFTGVPPLERIEMELLLEGIYRHYGYDFRRYAPSSLRRRLKKRLDAENLTTLSALQERVLHDPNAMEGLLRDMSVNVTGMFRDPTFFRSFRQKVVPMLRTYPFVRIWHAGCASGEEVYAMAILLEEEGLYERSRLYATDLNSEALARARTGIFPLSRMREYTINYQQAGGTRSFSEYYTASYGAALFHPRLRERILFAQHNLATDTSFSEFNIILCRNVLIYFDRSLKERTLRLFCDSLAPLGVLCLGRRESLQFTSVEEEFDLVDARERIFRRIR